MANTIIQLKHSTVTGNVPSSLANGEISINSRDGKLFYSTPLGVVTAFNPYPGPAGLDTEIQFNDSGSLGGSEKLTFNKTTGLLTVNGTVRANIFSDDGVDIFNFANNAFNTANSKTQVYQQNNAPSTAGATDFWIANTGVMYENFGNTTNPVWAEVGPTSVAANTLPGAITATTITTSNTINVTYTPATAIGYGITVNAANTQGGTGYADFLKVTNTSGGATNPNKSFRLSNAGGLEIINSAYSATLMSLSDAGAMSTALPYQVAGKQAVNGPAFSAYANATLQTITSGSQQKVLFQTEEFDTNNNYASSRFTPTVEGYYQLNAEVRLDGATGTGEMMIILYKNGSEYKRGTNQSGIQIATNFWAMTVSSLVYANGTGDYFEIYVQQGSGGNVTVTAVNNPAITWFNGCMLRGA